MYFPTDLLKGQAALVTGGGTRICGGIALALAAHGCDVAIASRRHEHPEPTAEEMAGAGVRALALTADVRGLSLRSDRIAWSLADAEGLQAS